MKLQRDIGLAVAMSLVIGTVIGSGIFMKPGVVLASAGSVSNALWAWVLGGLISLAGGLTIAEVSTRIPKTGGLYVYLEEVYGRLWGFLAGWVQTILYGPAVIGGLGLYFGSLFAHLFGLDPGWKTGIGILTVAFLALMNALGTKYGGWIQTVATAGKLVPIALIIVFGVWKGDSSLSGWEPITTEVSMGMAILATLWAYDGWMMVGAVAGEMRDPVKQLPRAIIGGLSIVMVLYLGVNVALLHVLSPAEIVSLGENAAGTAAAQLFGSVGGSLISVGILVSIFGCLNGKIFTFPRVPYAMADRGQLPASGFLSKVHPKFGTPLNAIALQAVLAILLMLVLNVDRLSDIAIFVVCLCNIFAFLALFQLRKRPVDAGQRLYRVPLYPWVPIAAIAGGIYVVYSMLAAKPFDALMAIGLTVIGWPLYAWMNRK
ncbi:MAG: amino acid permease [Tumebacillaceae bacterium]